MEEVSCILYILDIHSYLVLKFQLFFLLYICRELLHNLHIEVFLLCNLLQACIILLLGCRCLLCYPLSVHLFHQDFLQRCSIYMLIFPYFQWLGSIHLLHLLKYQKLLHILLFHCRKELLQHQLHRHLLHLHLPYIELFSFSHLSFVFSFYYKINLIVYRILYPIFHRISQKFCKYCRNPRCILVLL